MKKIKIITMLAILMLLIIIPITTRAEGIIETTTKEIETPEYKTTDVLKGEKFVASATNDEITLIAVNSEQEIINSEFGIKSQLYYTKDGENFEKVNLKQYLESKNIVLNEIYAEIFNIYEVNNEFYIKLQILYDYGYHERPGGSGVGFGKSKYVIVKTEDGKNFTEVKLPNGEYECTNLQLWEYKPDEFFAYIRYSSNGNTIEKFFTSSDFIVWNQINLPSETNNASLSFYDFYVYPDGYSIVFHGFSDIALSSKTGDFYFYNTSDFASFSCLSLVDEEMGIYEGFDRV